MEALRARARLIAVTRAFFVERGYFEVETPILSRDVCVDAHLDPFALDLDHSSTASRQAAALPSDNAPRPRTRVRYLQTSPEFAMKRLLAAGSGSIFEIARVFRADECGPLHNPEFTMLEWYRVGGDYLETMAEVGELVEAVYTAAGRPCLPSQRIATMTYCEAFQAALGVDPLGAPMELLRNLSAARGFIAGDRDNRDDLLNFLLSTAVQPSLPAAAFVCDYPATQAALAKLHPQRDDLALRFELYLHGIEICNGYSELTDADELRARNDRQNAARRAAGKRELPAHSQLLEAMDAGLPECTGVALGIDRLIALALGFESIDQVIALPWDQA